MGKRPINSYAELFDEAPGVRDTGKFVHTFDFTTRERYEKWQRYFGLSVYRNTDRDGIKYSSIDCYSDDYDDDRDTKIYFLEHPDGRILQVECRFKRPIMLTVNEANAWKLYNFINDWKSGKFGIVSLQEAIENNFRL